MKLCADCSFIASFLITMLATIKTCWLPFPIAIVVVMLVGVASSEASLHLPTCEEIDCVDALVEPSDADNGGTATSDEQPTDSDLQEQLKSRLRAILPTGPDSSSTSSSSSSNSGSGSTNCITTVSLAIDFQSNCMQRFQEERALLLPDPFGTSIFHPPRDWS